MACVAHRMDAAIRWQRQFSARSWPSMPSMPSVVVRSVSSRGELPGRLCEQPVGDLHVALPGGWAEVARDLSRALSAGCVLVAGRRRLYPVPPPPHDSVHSALSCHACDAAVDALGRALGLELAGQGFELSASGHVRPCPNTFFRKGTLDGMESLEVPAQIDAKALRELARYVSAHLSVSPGMQVVQANMLPPQLLQPLFLVCVGAGQVRVLTVAFVGGPVTGDRPDRKRTPYVLQLTTGDLLAGAAFISGEAAPGAVPRPVPMGFVVRYAAQHAGDRTVSTLDHIVSLERELFGAVDDGHWSDLAGHVPLVRAAARKRTAMNEDEVGVRSQDRSRAFSMASGYVAPAVNHSVATPSAPMQQLQPMPVLHEPSPHLPATMTLSAVTPALTPRTVLQARPRVMSGDTRPRVMSGAIRHHPSSAVFCI